jgi:hypothetical protein
MARNQAEKGSGIWLKTLLFGVLAIGGIGAAAVILQPMLVAPSSDVALIKAEPGPFREKPKDPGGTRIPHTDSTVMSMLGGAVDEQEEVEILQPPADVPEMPPLPETPDEKIVMAPAPAPVGQTEVTEAAGGEVAEPVEADAAAEDAGDKAPAQETEVAASNTEDAAVPEPAATDAASDTDAAPAASPQSMPQSKPAMPQSKPDVPITRKGPAVEGDEPLYLVQLAAFRNAETAVEQAAMLGGKHQSRLGGVELGTMKVDAGENGIFWRVITEPLVRTEADSLCSALKRAGQDCILRKFDNQSS